MHISGHEILTVFQNMDFLTFLIKIRMTKIVKILTSSDRLLSCYRGSEQTDVNGGGTDDICAGNNCI